MTHVIALEAGQSSQGTSEPITPGFYETREHNPHSYASFHGDTMVLDLVTQK